MATGFDKLMSTTPSPAMGKVRVGEPTPPAAGKKGVTIRAAVFFDGTKNNRANTLKRRTDKSILQVKDKDGGSSYGNYYSNPAIHEFMNKRNNPLKHEVSHYVEGIGTRDFKKDATKEVEVPVLVKTGVAPNGEDLVTWERKKVNVPLTREENGQDDTYGNGFGAGPTGIVEKVDSGIKQLRIKIKNAYTKEEYIEKIIFDVFGFSRGAAAARHFISRRDELLKGPNLRPWPGPRAPELVINFVGLYDTVSSYAKGYGDGTSLAGGIYVDGTNTDTIFCNDVKELGLNMGGIPKRVIHLTAADEHRQNFSLTNINSSLKAGVGFEMRLPGVHSDIGGSYVEAGQGALNIERRVTTSRAERQQLVDEGWYTPNQFVQGALPNLVERHPVTVFGHTFRTPQSGPDELAWYGVRSLTTDYQFITLKIMHEFATCGGKHECLVLATFDEADFANYKIPPALSRLGRYFCEEAEKRQGSHKCEVVPCPTPADTKWLRNHYLHRSAKQAGDGGYFDRIGMDARADTIKGKLHTERLIIPDDDLNFVPPSLRGMAEAKGGYHGY